MVVTGKGAELGVLFIEGEHSENAGKSNVVILDKTGTLLGNLKYRMFIFIKRLRRLLKYVVKYKLVVDFYIPFVTFFLEGENFG